MAVLHLPFAYTFTYYLLFTNIYSFIKKEKSSSIIISFITKELRCEKIGRGCSRLMVIDLTMKPHMLLNILGHCTQSLEYYNRTKVVRQCKIEISV
jgi:hypothetical protein